MFSRALVTLGLLGVMNTWAVAALADSDQSPTSGPLYAGSFTPVGLYGRGTPRAGDPPPPPEPARRRNSVWLGARLGYEFPFGTAFTGLTGDPGFSVATSGRDFEVSEKSLRGSGPSFGIDLGIRATQRMIPFLYYAHVFQSSGNQTTQPMPTSALRDSTVLVPAASSISSVSTNLFGFGIHYSFFPHSIGPAVELGVGIRLSSIEFKDGTTLSTDAFGTFRFGLGADITITEMISINPMLHVELGNYSDVTTQLPGQKERGALVDDGTYAYLGGTVGLHFDL